MENLSRRVTCLLALLTMVGLAGMESAARADWPNHTMAAQLAVTLAAQAQQYDSNLRLAGANVYFQQYADNYTLLSQQFNTYVANPNADYNSTMAQYTQLKTSYLNLRSVVQAQGTALPYAYLDQWYQVAFTAMTLDNGMNQAATANPPTPAPVPTTTF